VHLARELREQRSDGLPHYLEARQLIAVTRFAHAADLLAQARTLSLPTAEIHAEAVRLEGIARYAIRDLTTADKLFQMYGSDGSAAHAAEAEDYRERLRYTRARVAH
jgi:hypothetical protein